MYPTKRLNNVKILSMYPNRDCFQIQLDDESKTTLHINHNVEDRGVAETQEISDLIGQTVDITVVLVAWKVGNKSGDALFLKEVHR